MSRSWLYVLPAIIYAATFSILPMVLSLSLSFCNYNPGSGLFNFVGLNNYLDLFNLARFWNSLAVTFLFAASAITLELSLAFLISYLLSRETKLTKVARVALTIPFMLNPVAVSYDFKMIFDIDYGPLNFLLKKVGLPIIKWRTDFAFLTLLIVDAWQWVPFVSLVLLAGILSISPAIVESGKIDGASELQIFRYLIIPQVSNLITFLILFRLIELLKLFDIVYVLTGGGPGISTETIALFLYVTALQSFNLGRASAASVILLIFAIILGLMLMRVMRRR